MRWTRILTTIARFSVVGLSVYSDAFRAGARIVAMSSLQHRRIFGEVSHKLT